MKRGKCDRDLSTYRALSPGAARFDLNAAVNNACFKTGLWKGGGSVDYASIFY